MSSNQSLRVVFAGTPEFAATALEAILKAGHQVVAAYCQPDRAAGRGKKVQYGPVKQLAMAQQIPVEQPLNFKQPEAIDKLASYQADVMVVVAYGLLLPRAVLQIPRLGCVNIHASLLPRWRGAAPIQRAIEAGDKETGITIMQMDEGLDTGPELLRLAIPIQDGCTGGQLHDQLATLGGKAICQWLAAPGDYQPKPQQETLACYAAKLTKAEAEIDWHQPAAVIERRIRAFNPWPVAFTHAGEHRLRIWSAELVDGSQPPKPGHIVSAHKQGIDVICGDGQLLRLTSCQPDNSRRMAVADLLNSKAAWFKPGTQLGGN